MIFSQRSRVVLNRFWKILAKQGIYLERARRNPLGQLRVTSCTAHLRCGSVPTVLQSDTLDEGSGAHDRLDINVTKSSRERPGLATNRLHLKGFHSSPQASPRAVGHQNVHTLMQEGLNRPDSE